MTALSQATRRALQAGLANTRAADEIADILEVSNVLSAAEAAFLDGVTAGAVSASKAIVVDANLDAAGARNFTLGTAGATKGSLKIAGNTSGTVTVSVAAAAGTWTMQLPAAVGSAGQQLTDAAGDGVCTWAAAGSMREFKHVVEEVSGKAQQVLSKLLSIGVYDFTYRNEPGAITTQDFSTHYIGVMADELPEAMHHGGTIFNPVSAFGMALLAIKALAEEVAGLKAQLAAQ